MECLRVRDSRPCVRNTLNYGKHSGIESGECKGEKDVQMAARFRGQVLESDASVGGKDRGLPESSFLLAKGFGIELGQRWSVSDLQVRR